MSAVKTLTAAPDPAPDADFAARLARAADSIAAARETDRGDLIPELSTSWFTLVDALNGVAVPPQVLRADLYDLAEVLARVHATLPTDEGVPL